MGGVSKMSSQEVDTFINEAHSFLDRNPQLDSPQQTRGGMTFGYLRAISECPDCPGHFRVPYDSEGHVAWPVGKGDWVYLRCSECKGVWKFNR